MELRVGRIELMSGSMYSVSVGVVRCCEIGRLLTTVPAAAPSVASHSVPASARFLQKLLW